MPTGVAKRANVAWTAAELTPIGLHDARHAAASVLIAAGVNVKALSATSGTLQSRSRSTVTGTYSPATRTRRPG